MAEFKESDRKCLNCDRIANNLPANSGGGRPKTPTLKYAIVLTGLTPETLRWVEGLAAEGKAGGDVGAILNKFVENLEKTNDNDRD